MVKKRDEKRFGFQARIYLNPEYMMKLLAENGPAEANVKMLHLFDSQMEHVNTMLRNGVHEILSVWVQEMKDRPLNIGVARRAWDRAEKRFEARSEALKNS